MDPFGCLRGTWVVSKVLGGHIDPSKTVSYPWWVRSKFRRNREAVLLCLNTEFWRDLSNKRNIAVIKCKKAQPPKIVLGKLVQKDEIS